MACRLTCHKEAHIGVAAIDGLMRLLRMNLQALSAGKRVHYAIQFHGQLTLDHKEKLSRMLMIMTPLACCWWHALEDDRELR